MDVTLKQGGLLKGSLEYFNLGVMLAALFRADETKRSRRSACLKSDKRGQTGAGRGIAHTLLNTFSFFGGGRDKREESVCM